MDGRIPELSLKRHAAEPSGVLFGSDGRQLTFERPATVVFRNCHEQFIVAWVEMDRGFVVKAECAERIISAVREGILSRKDRFAVQINHNVVAVADFEDFLTPIYR